MYLKIKRKLFLFANDKTITFIENSYIVSGNKKLKLYRSERKLIDFLDRAYIFHAWERV